MESPLVARRDWPDVATATFDRVAASVRALRLAAFVAGLPAEQPASCHPTIRKCLKREVEVLEGAAEDSEQPAGGDIDSGDDFMVCEVLVERLAGEATAPAGDDGADRLLGYGALVGLCAGVYGAAMIDTEALRGAEPHAEFRCLLLSGTARQAKQLYRALHAAVDAFISDASCFLVLLAAHDAGCAALASRAANHALNRFSQASVWDVEGLQALPLPVLEQFVQSDHLKVFSELDIFGALETWVMADLDERKAHFAELMKQGLRYGAQPLLTMADLGVIDSSPALNACPGAVSTFVHAYLHAMGSYSKPSECNTCPRREYHPAGALQAA